MYTLRFVYGVQSNRPCLQIPRIWRPGGGAWVTDLHWLTAGVGTASQPEKKYIQHKYRHVWRIHIYTSIDAVILYKAPERL